MRTRACSVLIFAGVTLVRAVAVHAQSTAPTRVQANVPVRELSAPDAKSSEHFGTILNVRPLANGALLVNDGQRRQVVMLDATLNNRTVLIDSVSIGGQSYGATAAPIVPYLADSSLFVDNASLSLLVIDPNGKIVRVMAAAKLRDLRMLGSSASGVDAKGNLLYRALAQPLIAPTSDVTRGESLRPNPRLLYARILKYAPSIRLRVSRFRPALAQK
jgi:hypothetical protein